METCKLKYLSDFDVKLNKIDQRIRKLDNVKLRHVLNLESEFSDTKNLLKRLEERFQEIELIINEARQ